MLNYQTGPASCFSTSYFLGKLNDWLSEAAFVAPAAAVMAEHCHTFEGAGRGRDDGISGAP